MFPLISVITPTWQRLNLLEEAIENLRQQTYPNLEHVIVSEGNDDEFLNRIVDEYSDITYSTVGGFVQYRIVELGRNWSSYIPNAYCNAPMIVGQLVATGDFQTWMADDESMLPDHILSLYDLLITKDVDFTYSKTKIYLRDEPDVVYNVGAYPPQLGQITNCLHKVSLLRDATFRMGVTRANEWDLIERWLMRGAQCAMLDEVTMTHRDDNVPS